MCNCKSCRVTAEIVAVAMIRWFEHVKGGLWEGTVDDAWAELAPFLISKPHTLEPVTCLEIAVSLKGLLFAAAGITGAFYPKERRLRLVREPQHRLKDVKFSFVLDAATAVLSRKEGYRETT